MLINLGLFLESGVALVVEVSDRFSNFFGNVVNVPVRARTAASCDVKRLCLAAAAVGNAEDWVGVPSGEVGKSDGETSVLRIKSAVELLHDVADGSFVGRRRPPLELNFSGVVLSAGGKRGWLMFWIFVPVNLGRGFVWGSVHGLTFWVWVMRPRARGGGGGCVYIYI